MVFTPYGNYWRRVRMICSQHILNASKIAEFEEVRAVETEAAMRKLEVAAAAREVVDVDKVVGELIEDISMIIVVGSKGNERYDVKSVISEALTLAGKFNLADFIPLLRPFDFQGITKKVKTLRKKADEIFDNIIENHLKKEDYEKHKDILSTMLNLTRKENDEFKSFTRENVKAIMFELFAGGIDTTLATTIWGLSSLIKNPLALKKLQQELDVVVGEKQMVEEPDLSKIWYLDMVIKETTRLYLVVPFLVPHVAMKDVVIEGYTIPAKSRVIVNAWAIGRDPKVWSDNVEEFYPERFIHSAIDLNGQHFELLPFGAGRRICPGRNLGLTNVKLILAKLVHYFQWELPNEMEPQELDMIEEYGLSMPRAKHLLAIPSRRSRAPSYPPSSGQVEE